MKNSDENTHARCHNEWFQFWTRFFEASTFTGTTSTRHSIYC